MAWGQIAEKTKSSNIYQGFLLHAHIKTAIFPPKVPQNFSSTTLVPGSEGFSYIIVSLYFHHFLSLSEKVT